ncbi:tyrosine-type recombinase/integrase [Paenibacillus pinihumi]|uniref:tyrosine-type recombinase/integrase n=1 Tax=Paenibacillus pinihumi TaxID=669462 RepID=UPI000416B0D9|nr:tyrosine-type recombinase/integrase [Paenibacillus pinihumi]
MALAKRKRKIQITRIDFPELTLQEALDMVVATKKAEGLRERTINDYVKDFIYFTDWLRKFHPNITMVHELSPAIFRDHIAWMKYEARRYENHKYNNKKDHGVGLSDTTVNIRLRVLKAVFNQLERDGLIGENPIAGVKLLRQDVDLTNCLTDDEVKSILAQPNQRDFVGFRDYVAIVLLLDSGLRISELLSLRPSDVDFQSRFIELPGERNKNRKPRLVPISSHSVKLLLQLIGENKQHFTVDKLFLSVNGEPIKANHFNKRLKHHAERAGVVEKKNTAHVYRHTWAKNMILNGCDPFTLQKLGGWKDIRTLRRYIQMDTKEMRASHDNFTPVNSLVRGAKRH